MSVLSEQDQAAKRKARGAWEADRAQLLLHQPFLALLALQLELVPVVDARVPTAVTDGERVFANAHFLLGLSPADRLFVLAHEVWHCAAQHFLRRGGRDPELWNFACDHEVNALLMEQGLSLPEGAVLYPDRRGDNAETVHQWLLDNADQRGERPAWADLHELLELAEGPVDPDFQPGPGNWRDWPHRVVAAAQQVEQRHGLLPGSLGVWVNGLRRPALPWREVLARFLGETVQRRRQWSPPNRRYVAQGLYLPGWGEARAPGEELDIVVAVDTSGSTLEHLERFLSELTGMAASYGIWRIRLIMCDCRITSDAVLDCHHPADLSRMRFLGGGGTDFRPVFQNVESSRPRALVYLTDGFGPAPEAAPDYPVLWALSAEGVAPAPWGQVVRIPALETR